MLIYEAWKSGFWCAKITRHKHLLLELNKRTHNTITVIIYLLCTKHNSYVQRREMRYLSAQTKTRMIIIFTKSLHHWCKSSNESPGWVLKYKEAFILLYNEYCKEVVQIASHTVSTPAWQYCLSVKVCSNILSYVAHYYIRDRQWLYK